MSNSAAPRSYAHGIDLGAAVQIQDPPRMILPVDATNDNGGNAITNIYNPAQLPETVFGPPGKWYHAVRNHENRRTDDPPPAVHTGGRLLRIDRCSGSVQLIPVFTTSNGAYACRIQIWRIHEQAGLRTGAFDLPEGWEEPGIPECCSLDPAMSPTSAVTYHEVAPHAGGSAWVWVDPETAYAQIGKVSTRPGSQLLWFGGPTAASIIVPARGARYLLITVLVRNTGSLGSMGVLAKCL